MGGASDEFPLLAAYNLYAADIIGDGKVALFTIPHKSGEVTTDQYI